MPMIPTPKQVVPLLLDASEQLYGALNHGISYADALQPDPGSVDPWFWAHGARFDALRTLTRGAPQDWKIRPKVANSGIHLLIQDLHKARVAKAADGFVPAPGSSQKKRRDYVGIQSQLLYDMGEGLFLPALSLLIDWQVNRDREAVLHLSLPLQPWRWGQDPTVHWRVPLPPGGALSLTDMAFDPGSDDGDVLEVSLDPAESTTN